MYGSSVTKLAGELIAAAFVIRGSVAAALAVRPARPALADHDDFALDGLPRYHP